MEKVLKIIEKKLILNTHLDESDILSIINEYIKFYDLSSFVKKVYFVNKSNFSYSAFYNQEHFSLVFAMNKIYESAIANHNFVSKKNNINFNSFYNFYLLMALFHELKHIMQYKKLFLEIEDNFLKIYNIDETLRGIDGNNRNLYINYHDLFPCEREANVFSISETLKYYCVLSKYLGNGQELKCYQTHLLNLLLSNYENGLFKLKSPFERLLKLGNSHKLGYIEIVNEIYLPLYNRLTLGLPVTKEEYNQILDLCYLLKRGKLSSNESVEKIIVKHG